jgi:O-succinylbenzoate synthase
MVRAFAISSTSHNYNMHVLVRLHADGLTGWGEAACTLGPYYNEETYETCWYVLKDVLGPAVLNKEWGSIEELVANYRLVKRHNIAKAGLEMAAWDLLAQAQGQSLSAAVGGTRAEILSGVSLGIQPDVDSLFELIDLYAGQGYRRIKLKIGPGKDVPVIRAVRERYPDLPIVADANSAYTLADISVLKELDQFNLMMIEQPLAHDDIIDHAVLQRELRTPICLDESIHSAEDARKALDLDSGRIINIKVSRLGGLLEAKKVHDLCYERGIPVWCGGMHEFGIGRAVNVAIASLPGFTIPGDVCGFDKDYAADIVDPPIRAENGAIPVSVSPGLGWTPNEDRIEAQTVRRITIS